MTAWLSPHILVVFVSDGREKKESFLAKEHSRKQAMGKFFGATNDPSQAYWLRPWSPSTLIA